MLRRSLQSLEDVTVQRDGRGVQGYLKAVSADSPEGDLAKSDTVCASRRFAPNDKRVGIQMDWAVRMEESSCSQDECSLRLGEQPWQRRTCRRLRCIRGVHPTTRCAGDQTFPKHAGNVW